MDFVFKVLDCGHGCIKNLCSWNCSPGPIFKTLDFFVLHSVFSCTQNWPRARRATLLVCEQMYLLSVPWKLLYPIPISVPFPCMCLRALQIQCRNRSPVFINWLCIKPCYEGWNDDCRSSSSKLAEFDSDVWMIDYWLTRFGILQSNVLQGSCTKGPTVECLYWSFPWCC